jgi:hypothetical protein
MSHPLKTQNELNIHYIKLSDLPKNDLSVEMNETHRNRAQYILLPMAFVVDVVALPLELAFMLALAINGPGS